MLERALEIAISAHKGQRDRAKNPYILHVMRVVLRCSTERERIVAALHDVVEDSEIIIEDLRKEGFDDGILKSIECITRVDGEPYDQYILRCRSNCLARSVKIADVDDHLDCYTPGVVPDEHRIRYRKAYRTLTEGETE